MSKSDSKTKTSNKVQSVFEGSTPPAKLELSEREFIERRSRLFQRLTGGKMVTTPEIDDDILLDD